MQAHVTKVLNGVMKEGSKAALSDLLGSRAAAQALSAKMEHGSWHARLGIVLVDDARLRAYSPRAAVEWARRPRGRASCRGGRTGRAPRRRYVRSGVVDLTSRFVDAASHDSSTPPLPQALRYETGNGLACTRGGTWFSQPDGSGEVEAEAYVSRTAIMGTTRRAGTAPSRCGFLWASVERAWS